MSVVNRTRALGGVVLAIAGLGAAPASTENSREFAAYWYQGKAEITSYTLEQARYGEVHPGHAVLVFVTEDFSRRKLVKLDRPESAGNDRVPVMKLNFTKKFTTGIYPYSMMTSVFQPVDPRDGPHALKITSSSQEWCGHTFLQMNRRGDGYRVRQFSYFESEGDRDLTVRDAFSEDELWVTLRLDPDRLPTGDLRLVPGSMFLRLRHGNPGAQRARATLEPDGGNREQRVYRLEYPELDRTLTVHFEAAFPHAIESWEETYVSGWGNGARRLTTRARRLRRLRVDYWNHNRLEDAGLRRQLELP